MKKMIEKMNNTDMACIKKALLPNRIQFLFDAGVVSVFGPGTVIPEAAIELIEILLKTLHHE